VKRVFFSVILAILLTGIPLSGLSDAAVAVEDVASPNSEVAISVSKASNSSVSATITITMTGVIDK